MKKIDEFCWRMNFVPIFNEILTFYVYVYVAVKWIFLCKNIEIIFKMKKIQFSYVWIAKEIANTLFDEVKLKKF